MPSELDTSVLIALYDHAGHDLFGTRFVNLNMIREEDSLGCFPRELLSECLVRLERTGDVRVSGADIHLIGTSPNEEFGQYVLRNCKELLAEVPLQYHVTVLDKFARNVLGHQRKLRLPRGSADALRAVSERWSCLQSTSDEDRDVKEKAVIECLAKWLGFNILEDKWIRGRYVAKVDFASLGVIVCGFAFMSCADARSEGEAQESAQALFQIIKECTQSPLDAFFHICIDCSPQYESSITNTSDTIILIKRTSLVQYLLASDRRQRFSSFIMEALGILRVNPYQYESPVNRDEMFFGREAELRELLSSPNSNVAIYGCRRVGKTSLLQRLHRTLLKGNEKRVVYLPCSEMSCANDLVQGIVGQINARRKVNTTIDNFSQFIRTAASSGKSFVLLLDEVDGIIGDGRGAMEVRMFRILRDLAQSGLLRVIFTGFSQLAREWKNQESPFYNFAAPMRLSALDETSARNLIRIPLGDLRIHAKSEVVEGILQETGGYAYLIQFYCCELLKILYSNSTSRHEITLHHLKILHEMKRYYDELFQAFDTTANLDVLGKIIVLVMVAKDVIQASEVKIYELLRQSVQLRGRAATLNIERVQDALRRLELANFLELSKEWNYSFAIPAFPTALKRTRNIDGLISAFAGML